LSLINSHWRYPAVQHLTASAVGGGKGYSIYPGEGGGGKNGMTTGIAGADSPARLVTDCCSPTPHAIPQTYTFSKIQNNTTTDPTP